MVGARQCNTARETSVHTGDAAPNRAGSSVPSSHRMGASISIHTQHNAGCCCPQSPCHRHAELRVRLLRTFMCSLCRYTSKIFSLKPAQHVVQPDRLHTGSSLNLTLSISLTSAKLPGGIQGDGFKLHGHHCLETF